MPRPQNGLLKFKGRYHVFAQWGMDGHSGASWLHAVSSDLATWQMLPPAIVAGEGNESLSGEWDAGGVYSGHAMVLGGRPVLVYCALDGKMGKARRTVAWAEAEDTNDPQLLRFRKLENQPWVEQSLGNPASVGTYCDPLTWRSEGASGQQMVGAIVRSGPSSQITGWRVDSTASTKLQPSGPLFDLGFECLCPDFAFLGLGAAREPLWAAKCLSKCSDPEGHEVGCDVYAIGTKPAAGNSSEPFKPAKVLPRGRGAADRFPVLDHGMMASSAQTLQDGENQRVLLWQWLAEGDCQMGQQNCSVTATHGQLRDWEGVQTLPRLLRASDACHVDPALPACTLLVQAAPEITRLHTWHRNTSTSPASISVAAEQGPDALHVVAQFSQLGRGAVVAFAGSTTFNVTLVGGKVPAGINASSRMMNDTNFGGNNLLHGINTWPAATSTASQCQEACDKLPACLMWTFVAHARENTSEAMCCLKGGAVLAPSPEAGCASGVKDPGTYRLPPRLSIGPAWRHNLRSVPMQLKETVGCQLPASASSSPIELSVFLDHSIVEVFTGTGHCAFAVRVYQEEQPQPPPPRTVRALAVGGGHSGGGDEAVASLEVFGMAAAYRDYQPARRPASCPSGSSQADRFVLLEHASGVWSPRHNRYPFLVSSFLLLELF